jgi:hypothetical protein
LFEEWRRSRLRSHFQHFLLDRQAAKIAVDTTFIFMLSAGGEGPLSVTLFRPSDFFATSNILHPQLYHIAPSLNLVLFNISVFITLFAFLQPYRPSSLREALRVHRFLSRHIPHICSFAFHEHILLLKSLAYKLHTTASA